MLPAWATVVVSLGGAFAVAAASVGVTWLRIRFDREQQRERLAHEREAAWRDRMVAAAADYSTGVEQAILGVRNVITAVYEKQDVEPVVQEAKRLLHEAVARLARVKLLFGQDAEATKAAGDLLPELDLARGAATKLDPTFAWQKLEKVYALHKEFNTAALTTIRQPHWIARADLRAEYRIEGAAASGRPPGPS